MLCNCLLVAKKAHVAGDRIHSIGGASRIAFLGGMCAYCGKIAAVDDVLVHRSEHVVPEVNENESVKK